MRHRIRTTCLTVCLLAALPDTDADAGYVIISDFDDGTTQGWTRSSEPGGTLFYSATGGNPGGFIGMRDTSPGAGEATAVYAPSEFTGDLSVYEKAVWDEFVYNHGDHTKAPTSLLLIGGPNRTAWFFAGQLNALSEWVHREVSLQDSTGWSRLEILGATGNDSFDAVVSNVELFRIGMDTSDLASNTLEAGIDNVGFRTTVVPEPSTLMLLGIGVCGLVVRRQHKRLTIGLSDREDKPPQCG